MDWQTGADYDRYADLVSGEWAWQFLRRNPAYRTDFAWFIEAWNTLEARYGKPPQRDFFHWRQDPLAWRSEIELKGCGTDVCPGQDDQVLIECWMGAKWGFRRFPPDPALDFPLLGDELVWREADMEALLLDDAPAQLQPDHRISLVFDPLLPIDSQLASARRVLAARRHAMKAQGKLPPVTNAQRQARWTRQLRLLDGLEAGAEPAVLAAELGLDDPDQALEQAQWMIQYGYRYLPILDSQPDKGD